MALTQATAAGDAWQGLETLTATATLTCSLAPLRLTPAGSQLQVRPTLFSAQAPYGQASGPPFVPGIVLGPPGDSSPVDGSFTVATLGYGGSVTVAYDDVVIEDRPGPDFIVFENAFFDVRVLPPSRSPMTSCAS